MLPRRTQLHYFITVADEGHITGAARKLHVAQPTLSHAIARLESELGVELLARHAHGVSLTSAGEAFLAKARAAYVAENDAARTAQSLARAVRGTIALGFIGPPPPISHPELFAALADKHPELEVSFQDLPFPRGATADWLAEVDVAICHLPQAEDGICAHALRIEPRALVAHADHPLARRGELAVADVLDETFVSYHSEVQPQWAGFHSLDDHRGGPPSRVTGDQATTTLHMLAAMTAGKAVTTVPVTDARVAHQVVPSVAVMPLGDAEPAKVSLVWPQHSPNPHVASLIATAERLRPSSDGV
jgi:DNA-binding transcriptional LysR family regulator